MFGHLELYGTLFSEVSSKRSAVPQALTDAKLEGLFSKSVWLSHRILCFCMWYLDLLVLVTQATHCNNKVAACLSLVEPRIGSQCVTGVWLKLSVLNAVCANLICLVVRERPVLCLIPH